MKKIIGFVGPMASGKGAASDYLRKKHDAGYHRFSTMIRDVMRRLDIEDSRENMQKLSVKISSPRPSRPRWNLILMISW
jgi:dephospho-CoA kinase